VAELAAGLAAYLGPGEITQFRILGVSLQAGRGGRGVEVELRLARRYQFHLATTFLPSLALMAVCQTTLYFKSAHSTCNNISMLVRSEHFKTSVPVAITSMLVTYTLYQSVSSKLPPTSYLKMIDIWLLFGLILPLLVGGSGLSMLTPHMPDICPVSRHRASPGGKRGTGFDTIRL
jgi:hypothetical protein